MYQKSADALSAIWHYNDTESQIERAWFTVGTYPYADDIFPKTVVNISSTLKSDIPLATVLPDLSGKCGPYFTILLFYYIFDVFV